MQNTIDYPDTCSKACVTIRLIVMMLGGEGQLWDILCTCALFNIKMGQINSLQGFCLQLTARLNGRHLLECITLDCANEHVDSFRAEFKFEYE